MGGGVRDEAVRKVTDAYPEMIQWWRNRLRLYNTEQHKDSETKRDCCVADNRQSRMLETAADKILYRSLLSALISM